jgi:hypothetical protein
MARHLRYDMRRSAPASRDLDEDLVGPWRGDRQLHLAEWLGRPVEHHRLHRGWRHYNILRSEGRRATTCQYEWQLKRYEVPECGASGFDLIYKWQEANVPYL